METILILCINDLAQVKCGVSHGLICLLLYIRAVLIKNINRGQNWEGPHQQNKKSKRGKGQIKLSPQELQAKIQTAIGNHKEKGGNERHREQKKEVFYGDAAFLIIINNFSSMQRFGGGQNRAKRKHINCCPALLGHNVPNGPKNCRLFGWKCNIFLADHRKLFFYMTIVHIVKGCFTVHCLTVVWSRAGMYA